MAAAVTVTDAVVAFPFAYYMARIAGPRQRTVLTAGGCPKDRGST